MTKTSLEAIIASLNHANVRYLVVGGLAVNAHGYVRMTVDVDLLIQLEETNLLAALQVLAELGYRPALPVTAAEFANPANRAAWVNDKHMQVLNLISDLHRETSIDVFASDPLGFDSAIRRVHLYALSPEIQVPVCAYEDLIKLKLHAARAKDLADVEQLRKIRGES